jgi:D-alanyl-D-alanine carboxypeptidase/D-alanyl-D-alanine-endopeptidase (penicillin-binding protein 4)
MKKILLLLVLHALPLFADPALPGLEDNMSLVIMQAKDGQVLYAQHPNQPMTPASTTKLLTAYTALQRLGPQFSFKTQAYRQGNHLILQFSGDPSLRSKDLSTLLHEALLAAKITQIPGDIILDVSAFSSPWVARGWSVDDIPWYYAAPVHALILDENRIAVRMAPPTQLGENVQFSPLKPEFHLISRVKAVSETTADTLCQLDVTLPGPGEIFLEGCWPVNNPMQYLFFANTYPVETAKNLLHAALKAEGVTLSGKIRTGETPSDATLLASHSSAPLSELIKPILQDSNNLYTEALTKTLGAQAYQRATFQAGSYYIQNQMRETLALNPTEINLVDGSGLSPLNLISANALAQLLHHAYLNESLSPSFLTALASSGSTGKLKGRFKSLDTPFVGKTGSMTHVSALAGYYGLSTDNPLIYVIMINNATQKDSALKRLEDQLISTSIQSYFTNNSMRDKL